MKNSNQMVTANLNVSFKLMSREELKLIFGGTDEQSVCDDGTDSLTICTKCSDDTGCDGLHMCDSSSSCPQYFNVCVLKTRRQC